MTIAVEPSPFINNIIWTVGAPSLLTRSGSLVTSFLFPKPKKDLAGSGFNTDEELITPVQGCLQRLWADGLYHVFVMWAKRRDVCLS